MKIVSAPALALRVPHFAVDALSPVRDLRKSMVEVVTDVQHDLWTGAPPSVANAPFPVLLHPSLFGVAMIVAPRGPLMAARHGPLFVAAGTVRLHAQPMVGHPRDPNGIFAPKENLGAHAREIAGRRPVFNSKPPGERRNHLWQRKRKRKKPQKKRNARRLDLKNNAVDCLDNVRRINGIVLPSWLRDFSFAENVFDRLVF